MPYLKKLHNHREPPGLEWRILKKMPSLTAGSFAVPLLMALFARLIASEPQSAVADKQLLSLDIFAIALWITFLTALFTVAIACVIVVLMKGPAYVADAYELEDHDHPAPDKQD